MPFAPLDLFVWRGRRRSQGHQCFLMAVEKQPSNEPAAHAVANYILSDPEQPGRHVRLAPAHEPPTKSNDKDVVYQIFEIGAVQPVAAPALHVGGVFSYSLSRGSGRPLASSGSESDPTTCSPILLRDIHLSLDRRRPYRFCVDHATRAVGQCVNLDQASSKLWNGRRFFQR